MRRTTQIAATAALLLAPALAAAEPTDPWQEPLGAGQARRFQDDELALIRKANAAEAAGKTDAALDLYAQANQLRGSVDTAVELGLAYMRAKRYVEAATELVLVKNAASLKVRSRSVVNAAFDEAKKHVGAVRIYINVVGAKLDVNGIDVADWPFLKTVFVEPNREATVTASKKGYWTAQARLHVAAGEEKNLLVAMQEQIIMKNSIGSAPVFVAFDLNRGGSQAGPTWPQNLLIVSGVGVGLGVGALATGLIMVPNDERWRGVAVAGGVVGALSLTGIVIGAAGLAARPSTPPILLAPVVTPEGGGVGVQGRF